MQLTYEKDKAGIVLEAGDAGDQRAFEPGGSATGLVRCAEGG